LLLLVGGHPVIVVSNGRTRCAKMGRLGVHLMMDVQEASSWSYVGEIDIAIVKAVKY